MAEQTVTEQAVDVAFSMGVLVGAMVLAVAIWIVLSRSVLRLSKSDVFARHAIRLCRWPGRLTVAIGSVLVTLPITELELITTTRLERILQLLLIAAATWFLLRLGIAIELTLLHRLPDAEEETDTAARSRGRRTKIIVMRRLASAAVIVMALGGALLTFPPVRTLGASLLASAGILGIVVGVAAQSTLANVIAGLQIAIAEPLSIDDAVVVEGEWGNVEQVHLTHIVVRLWDRRRLVLPTSYFVTNPFHNWSMGSTQVIGSVELHLDHRAPLPAIREEFHRLVDRHPLWDGDIAVLQVIDSSNESIVVRGLATAATASKAWDLRCALREDLIGWLTRVHPEALPVHRVLEGAPTPTAAVDWPEGGRREAPSRRRSPGPETMPAPDPARTGEWPVLSADD